MKRDLSITPTPGNLQLQNVRSLQIGRLFGTPQQSCVWQTLSAICSMLVKSRHCLTYYANQRIRWLSFMFLSDVRGTGTLSAYSCPSDHLQTIGRSWHWHLGSLVPIPASESYSDNADLIQRPYLDCRQWKAIMIESSCLLRPEEGPDRSAALPRHGILTTPSRHRACSETKSSAQTKTFEWVEGREVWCICPQKKRIHG